MSSLRNPATFAGLWLAAGCNALFGVEEPNLISEANGGEAGQPGGPGLFPSLPEAGDGGEAGEGGAAGEGDAGEAGAGGGWSQPQVPGAAGELGGGGTSEPPVGLGGAPLATGGSPAPVAAGAGGEAPSVSGGAAGAAGTTGSACISGDRYCDDDTLVTCEQGSPLEEPCPFGCESNACRPECTQPSIECRNNNQRVCGSDGRWGPEQACGDQTCVPDKGCSDCAPGDVRCNAQSGDAEQCVDGEWHADVCQSEERCVLEAGVSRCIDNVVFSLPDTTLPGGTLFDRTPDVLYAYPLRQSVGPDELVALQIGAVGAKQPANARLALYADNGAGYPGELIGRTNTLSFSGSQEVISDLTPRIRTLEPEQNYWIGIVFAPGGVPQLQCRHDDEAPGGLLVHQPFEDTIPTIFPTSEVLGDADMECNLFLRVRYRTPD